MHMLDEVVLGIGIVCLLGMLVAVKRAATGSILDKPGGTLLVQLVNIFNLFFLLVVNPLAALLLITRQLPAIDPTHLENLPSWVPVVTECAGLLFYVTGFLLMAWSLTSLGRNYQLGGSAPRTEDSLITNGPYRVIRHPMYTAALSISLGLALLLQSLAFLRVFTVYLVLVLLLIPTEEEKLLQCYGGEYLEYRKRTQRLLPLAY